ncbi:hypothetical protein A4X06_0g8537 [Tilletia controversa]|uniref:Uncharacterized protein n=1 Tax=Tilletia controversa TaxID=13291 RepID=A0A8X7SSZ4_9BASI|nr:hypothetical protein A4X06_0g8537 [Tilletia controversa]
MEQSSAKLLQEIMPSLFLDQTLGLDGADVPLISQAKRMEAEYARLNHSMMSKLSLEEAQTVVANGEGIGAACLQTFPIDARTTLSDRQVQVTLHNRTIIRAIGPICPDCMHPNIHGHDDDCGDRPHRRTVRHDTSKYIYVAALRRIKGVRVNPEPRIEAQSMRRTDWRVHGPAAAGGGGDTDYDITFVSLTNAGARGAPGRAEQLLQVEELGMRAVAKKRLHAYLDAKAQHKSQYYTGAVPTAFVPLVFSLEGAMQTQAKATLKQWRSLIPSFSYVVSCLSVVLARTRAETFRLV